MKKRDFFENQVKPILKKLIKIKDYLLIGRKPKIFCISFQRTGTTSVGKFFEQNGFNVATYYVSKRNEWSLSWFKGDYQNIFNSIDFKSNQVFEDDPWWCMDFYKVLYHQYPNSKFILIERDSDKWFDSMVSHSDGRNLGNTYRHSKIYRRESEYYSLGHENKYSSLIDNLLPLNEDHREHYKSIYELKNKEVKEFFREFDSKRLFNTTLENPDKWHEMAKYFNFKIPHDYEVHANKSKKK